MWWCTLAVVFASDAVAGVSFSLLLNATGGHAGDTLRFVGPSSSDFPCEEAGSHEDSDHLAAVAVTGAEDS